MHLSPTWHAGTNLRSKTADVRQGLIPAYLVPSCGVVCENLQPLQVPPWEPGQAFHPAPIQLPSFRLTVTACRPLAALKVLRERTHNRCFLAATHIT